MPDFSHPGKVPVASMIPQRCLCLISVVMEGVPVPSPSLWKCPCCISLIQGKVPVSFLLHWRCLCHLRRPRGSMWQLLHPRGVCCISISLGESLWHLRHLRGVCATAAPSRGLLAASPSPWRCPCQISVTGAGFHALSPPLHGVHTPCPHPPWGSQPHC